jgi:hypothetical protein
MTIVSPFHAGERKIQELAGESAIAERNGALIADRIFGGALSFLRQQSMAVLGTQDPEGTLWCSLLFGRPGFLSSVDGSSVKFDLKQAVIHPRDPLWANLKANPEAGMLVIELGSRRRIRINGRLSRPDAYFLRLEVQEAYPNCPKYITRRQLRTTSLEAPSESVEEGVTLTRKKIDLLRRSDVLFIATANPHGGADASHRGGSPGFIEILDERTLRAYRIIAGTACSIRWAI